MAFLEEYRKYRGTDNLATQEVEYNFGRFFHQLSAYFLPSLHEYSLTLSNLDLGSFAAGHYKRVLELAEEWQKSNPDVRDGPSFVDLTLILPQEPGFGPEAAYNLSLLYVLSGATQLAKELYQRWLSI